jgi:hypothetical protein
MKKIIHTITAEWLFKKLNYSGEPRMIIKGKYLLVWGKDQWGDEKPEKYKFLGYCQNKYAFRIQCNGKSCTWSHDDWSLIL